MEDFSDIIYFIVLVVFSLIGLFNKKKKEAAKKAQQQQARPVTPVQEEETDLWAEFEAFWGEEQGAKQEEKPREPSILSYETATDYSDLKVKNRMKGTITRSESIFKKMAPIAEDKEQITYEVSLDDEEELRRAFVYSEILNRKYT